MGALQVCCRLGQRGGCAIGWTEQEGARGSYGAAGAPALEGAEWHSHLALDLGCIEPHAVEVLGPDAERLGIVERTHPQQVRGRVGGFPLDQVVRAVDAYHAV